MRPALQLDSIPGISSQSDELGHGEHLQVKSSQELSSDRPPLSAE